MKPDQKNSAEKAKSPKEGWALMSALLVVGLLIGFLLTGGDEGDGIALDTPGTLHAAVSEPDLLNAGPVNAGPADSPGLHEHGDGASKYACPMMCVPPADKPGRCPVCGMALTRVETREALSEGAFPRLQLSAESVHLAEIRTAPAMRMAVANRVRLYGRVDYDSAHITQITAFMPGVIDRVYVKRAGQFVRWGDPLFDIYSSDLLETQRQLARAMQHVPSFLSFQANTPHVAQDVPIQARKGRSAGSAHSPEQKEALQQIKALRHKLSILGLPKRDIDEFMKKGEATGIATVYAPMYGQITVQDATEGTFVNTGTSLFTIADPKYVWARLDVYESDYPWIRIGQRVTFTSEAYPGDIFEARVGYIDPVFDSRTRTFSIGAMTTQDQGGRLKAGMLIRAHAHARMNADGHLAARSAGAAQAPLVIPVTAPLITGRRAVVYVAIPGDTPVFEGREVVLGPRAQDHYVVREGLTEGEQVVVNGNFKIDSAMQILAKPSAMSPSVGAGGTGHQHHGNQALEPQHQAEMRPPAATPEPGQAAHANSLADSHQHPDLSGQMHNDYMQQRRSSRTMVNSPAMEMGQTEGGGMSAKGHDHHPSASMPDTTRITGQQHDNRLVRRRKPGQYGDTTRQGASMLEEHRQRWRRK